MDPASYLRVLRDRWVLLVVPVVVGVLIGIASWVVTDDAPDASPYFRATHTLSFTAPPNDATWAFQNLDQVARLATGGDVPLHVAQAFSEDPNDLARRITTRANPGTGTIEVTVVGDDARETQAIADTLANEMMTATANTEQTRFAAEQDAAINRVRGLQAQLADVDAQLAQASSSDRDLLTMQRTGILNQYWFAYEQTQRYVEQGAPTERLATFDTASAEPISADAYRSVLDLSARGQNNQRVDPNAPSDALASASSSGDGAVARGVLGGFIGLLAGLGLVYLVEVTARPLRSRREVEAAFDAPVLAEIPRLRGGRRQSGPVVVHASRSSRAAEGYRTVRSWITMHAAGTPTEPGDEVDGAPRPDDAPAGCGLVVLIVSASPEEGRTTTTANLAAAFAEAGSSVLAVNCDFRRPMLPQLLGVPDASAAPTRTDIPDVSIVSVGILDPSLTPPRAVALQRTAIEEARRSYDVVLVDTAPLLTTNDTTELVAAADVVVLVARVGVTTQSSAERVRHALDRLGASVPGVVLFDLGQSASDRVLDPTVRISGQEVDPDLGRQGPRARPESSRDGGEPVEVDAGLPSPQSTADTTVRQ